MAKLYKIREQDLDEELLKRLFSSGNTGINLETVLNDYLKKTDKITKSNIDEELLAELKESISQTEIDLSNYREKSVLIGMDDLTSELSGAIIDLQKQIEGLTDGSDVSNLSGQLDKIRTRIAEIQIEVEENKSLADDKISILTEDLILAKERISALENKIKYNVRLKSEKIEENDLSEELIEKINEAYDNIGVSLNELEFKGDKGKFISLDDGNHLRSSEILIFGYFLTDETVINTFLENKTIKLFFDLTNNIQYRLKEKEITTTTTDEETGEEVEVVTKEYYYESTEQFFNTNTEYKYRLLFDQYSRTLYYCGQSSIHTLIKSGGASTETNGDPTTVVKRKFTENSINWIEEYTDDGDIVYSITFNKGINDAVISDVYMLEEEQYRSCIVDIYTTDATVTIKAMTPFTGYFIMSAVEVSAIEELDNVAERLDEINGEVI